MLVLAAIFIILCVYLYVRWKYTYWKRVGLEQIEPTFPFGSIRNAVLGKLSFGKQYQQFYNEFRARGLKHGGIYEFFNVKYFPVDLDIIKHIMQKDFRHFMNHGEHTYDEREPLTGHLLGLGGEKWKKLRSKLTPVFTSGKMKMMFPTMVACTGGLVDILQESVVIQDAVDIKDVLLRFTTDVIGSTAFGLECNSLKNPDSEFRVFGKKLFETNTLRMVKRLMSISLPKIVLNAIGIKKIERDIEDFFMGIVKSTVNYREQNNVYRKDFMHLMLQLKNRGKVTDDEHFKFKENEDSGNGDYLSFNEVAAQCFVFFIAGFETSGTTMTFALLELAQNFDIQEKVREEVIRVEKKYNNQITYDAIMEMTYLDKVVHETLRKHPPAASTGRMCNETYTVPNTDITIQKGVRLMIPILGIHRDPEYYPEPEKFDPERFSEENKNARHGYSFIPFGEGPRMCIGARFGLLQAKVGLATILKNFKVTLNSKTQVPIVYEPRSHLNTVKGGVWLNFKNAE